MNDPHWGNLGRGPWGIDDGAINLMLLAEQREQEEIQERVREAREYFETVPDFRFEDFVGNGAYGVTIRVGQRGFGLRRSRRLIVKRAMNDRVAGELSNEIRMMSRLSGSAHIASIIAHNDNYPLQPRRRFKRIRRIINRFMRKPPSNFLAGLAGPTLVLEYLGNGSLSQLRRRLEYERQDMPNRVLWPIFLCLVRACVAMKYPPNALPDSRPKLEEVPPTPPGGVPNGILHGDMHAGNIFLGTPGDFKEHSEVPPVKLIDFGLAMEDNLSAPRNLLDVSKNVMHLILRKTVPIGAYHEVHRGKETMGVPLLRDLETGQEPNPLLDPELRDILVECMASNPVDRPGLARVLQTAKLAV